MKKFKFPLDTVLSYKQQVLDALRGEHAAILAEVRTQEDWVEHLWQQYRAYSEEYRQRTETGLLVTEALMYQTGLRSIELEIQRETEKLDALRAKEEEKRAQVVEAKKDTSSIEKLREKKLDAYQKEAAKSEEIFIEEFVSTMRVVNGSA